MHFMKIKYVPMLFFVLCWHSTANLFRLEVYPNKVGKKASHFFFVLID